MNLVLVSGLLGQWVGTACIIAGLIYEVKYKAGLGYVLITAGSLIFAIATKLVGF